MAQVCYKVIVADAALAAICLLLAILLLVLMAELRMAALAILLYFLAAQVVGQ